MSRDIHLQLLFDPRTCKTAVFQSKRDGNYIIFSNWIHDTKEVGINNIRLSLLLFVFIPILL